MNPCGSMDGSIETRARVDLEHRAVGARARHGTALDTDGGGVALRGDLDRERRAAPRFSVIVSESPGSGVISSPERKPKPASVSTRGRVSTAVERVGVAVASRGAPSTAICTDCTPAAARLCLELRLHAVERRRGRAPSAASLELHRGRAVDIHRHGLRRERDILGNGREDGRASHGLGAPSIEALAMRVAAFAARGEPADVGHEELPRGVEVHHRVGVEDGDEEVAVEHDAVPRLDDAPLAVLLLRQAERQRRGRAAVRDRVGAGLVDVRRRRHGEHDLLVGERGVHPVLRDRDAGPPGSTSR